MRRCGLRRRTVPGARMMQGGKDLHDTPGVMTRKRRKGIYTVSYTHLTLPTIYSV